MMDPATELLDWAIDQLGWALNGTDAAGLATISSA